MNLEETHPIRISLPSKGRLAEDCLAFLAAAGLSVYRPNPRQYEAVIPSVPGLRVLFQRPADIVTSVREGSVDFGITGMDVIEERRGDDGQLLVLHDALNFGGCMLALAVPETWETVTQVEHIACQVAGLGRPLRIATKYPVLTQRFLDRFQIPHELIYAEGTLETAPAIGYADMICDIVSSGQTLRDNRLRPLPDGVILRSQASLISNVQVRVKKLDQQPRTCTPVITWPFSPICAGRPPRPSPRRSSPNPPSAGCRDPPSRASSFRAVNRTFTQSTSSTSAAASTTRSTSCAPSAAAAWW